VFLALLAVVVVLLLVLSLVGWALWAVISTAVVGLVIGGLARLVVPGRQPIGLLATIFIGFIGSIGGGVIGHAAGLGHLATVLVEVGVSAVVVVAAAGTGAGRRVGAGGRPSLGRGLPLPPRVSYSRSRLRRR
jgi:uncharacterized membrane protein YeaQ/YmgE (transglycosylase-associated protein family)